jgi:hypothetical protein
MKMRNIFVQLAVQQVALADGVVFDHIDITVTDSAGVDSTQGVNGHEAVPYRASFSVPEGQTKAIAQAFDDQGNKLGPAIQGSLNVPAVATFPQPVTLTLNLAP